MIKNKSVFIPIIIAFASLVGGCKSQYDKGYEKGYSSGYSEGKTYGYQSGKSAGYSLGKHDGYQEGKGDGYKTGYANGTVEYVKEHGLPSLGLALIILIFLATFYYIYKYFKNPTIRVIDNSTDAVEAIRQKKITQKELFRKKISVEEQARIRAANLASRVFEKTIKAISDEKSRSEIEKLKNEAEKKVLDIQLNDIARVAEEYQKSIEKLKGSRSLTSRERANLFTEIREVFGES